MDRDARAPWLAAIAGAGAPFAVAGALIPLRNSIDNANVALLLAATVVVVASSGHRAATLLAAVSGTVWFDVLHTRPYGSLSISRSDDIVTAGVLLVVGIAVGELAIRNRRHAAAYVETREEIGRIQAVADLVAHGDASEHVVLTVAAELRRLLSLRDCRFEPGSTVQGIRPRARVTRNGEVVFGELWWSAQTMGLPGKEVELPVTSHGRLLGTFILAPTPGEHVSSERRLVAVALADQVASALCFQPLHGRFDAYVSQQQRRQPSG